MPEAPTWSHSIWGSPHMHFLIRANVAGSALVILVMIVRPTSATTIRKLWKTKFITQVLEGAQQTQGHTRKPQVKKEKAQNWGSAFIGVKGRVPRVSEFYSSWVNLKEEWELGLRKEKSEVIKVFSYLGYPGLSIWGTFMSWSSLASYLGVLLVIVSCQWQYVCSR